MGKGVQCLVGIQSPVNEISRVQAGDIYGKINQFLEEYYDSLYERAIANVS